MRLLVDIHVLQSVMPTGQTAACLKVWAAF
jgi:hypothetical protein